MSKFNLNGNKLTGSALIAVAVMMGAAAFAQDAGMGKGHGAGPMFDFATLDADKDGKVTKAEIEAQKAARFEQADTNKDGKLSAEEIAVARDAMIAKRKADRMAQMIARMDTDGDGMISMAEMPTPPNADEMFDRVDTDKDGAISQAEADAAKEMMQDRMGKRGDRDGHGKGRGEGKEGHGHDGSGRDGHGKGHGGFWDMFGDAGPEDAEGN